jgi:formyltetrahydrofolate deformylase
MAGLHSAHEAQWILTLSCQDVYGIVADVSGALRQAGGFIIESAQFGDPSTGQFFMRTVFALDSDLCSSIDTLRHDFSTLAVRYSMKWELVSRSYKPRMLMLVSKQSHCLNDILHRYHRGALPVEIPAILSNHRELENLALFHQVPFFYLPVSAENRAKQEEQILDLIKQLDIDLVVLARYMQILSPYLAEQLEGRAINIHHSFLPSFKGARPYHQAFDKGVKLIGATAHYVNNALDEGPIIEQEVVRVNHTHSPEQMTALGRDIECVVLARAILYHIERRVLLNASKTVIFS